MKEKEIEDILDEMEEKIKKECSSRGGVVIESSECCGAPIIDSEGGVKIPICSKCKKAVSRMRIG